jgi:cyclic beta-1,2-glucan synthetase
MYRAGIEGILGIRREGAFLIINPCIPAAWPGFEATVNTGATHYDIRVETRSHRPDTSHAVLDGSPLCCAEGHVRVPLDGKTHRLLIFI